MNREELIQAQFLLQFPDYSNREVQGLVKRVYINTSYNNAFDSRST